MADVHAIPRARVPVCKARHAANGTCFDVTINNHLALINTKLLRDYAELDPRLRQLVFLVKHWAKQRGVNDSYRGSLSSYAYVLLCIHLLQRRSPPVLPVLQHLAEPPAGAAGGAAGSVGDGAPDLRVFSRAVGGWRCEFYDDAESLRGVGSANTESLAQLLLAFFDYWAVRHDYNHAVATIRVPGGLLSKASKNWTMRHGSERHLVCIEDPFELSHDLGRTIDKVSVVGLRREFERAARVLASAPDPLPLLFQPLRQE